MEGSKREIATVLAAVASVPRRTSVLCEQGLQGTVGIQRPVKRRGQRLVQDQQTDLLYADPSGALIERRRHSLLPGVQPIAEPIGRNGRPQGGRRLPPETADLQGSSGMDAGRPRRNRQARVEALRRALVGGY